VYKNRKPTMTKISKLFGTDGIRQQVGQFPLDDHSIARLGRAVGTLIPGSKKVGQVIFNNGLGPGVDRRA